MGSVAAADPQQQKLSREARQAELEDLGPAPEPPLTPLLTCTEPTFEGLCLLLEGGQPSVGVFSAEGGQFLGGYGMSKDHRLKTAAALSGIWDGEPIKRVRRGDGVVLLPGRRVAMHLLVQPGVSDLLLGGQELNDQGLVSRVLASAPATTAGSRFWREPKPESERAIQRYGARILQILEHACRSSVTSGTSSHHAPCGLRAAPGETSSRSSTMWSGAPPARPARSRPRLREQAARACGSARGHPDPGRATRCARVSGHHLEGGILLAEHYAAEARRLQDAGRSDPDLDLARRALDWLAGEWPGKP